MRSRIWIVLAAVTLLGVAVVALAGAGGAATGATRTTGAVAATPRGTAVVPASVTIDLCAKAGTVAIPGTGGIPIWGFALKPLLTDCGDASVEAGIPGPVLDVGVGNTVTIVLHNELADPVSIRFPGLEAGPEAPGGGTATYTFTPSESGTYLYSAETDPSRQVPMGLYGAFIVEPVPPGQAYADPASAYDKQAVLVLSEIDPALNADPAGFNLLRWAPRYWLINGKAYPDTGSIPADPGDRLLLRYLNAGEDHHTMTLLGAHQQVFAKDAYPLPFPFDVVAETIAAGQTADMIVTVPAAAADSKLALYSRQLHVTNGDSFPGGMLTFIDVASAGAPAGGTPPGGAPGEGSDSGLVVAPRLLRVGASVRGHRVRIVVRQLGCDACTGNARLRVRGHVRIARLRGSSGVFAASFRGVPSGRWAYRIALRDSETATRLSARRTLRVR
jgi:FtsP/CotA-like multicopper oxidase with cupredoxin domain